MQNAMVARGMRDSLIEYRHFEFFRVFEGGFIVNIGRKSSRRTDSVEKCLHHHVHSANHRPDRPNTGMDHQGAPLLNAQTGEIFNQLTATDRHT